MKLGNLLPFYISIFIFLLFFMNVLSDENEDFIPTSEWKEIKSGQKVPKGLHIRINLETGKKEGKLIDQNMAQKEQALSVTNTDFTEESSEDYLNNIKKLTKNIKDDSGNARRDSKLPYRKYDEIKKDLADINLFPKTDLEVITELVAEYKEELLFNNLTKILTLLDEFEYLSHQIDNAIEFSRLNGFQEIIYKNFNNSNIELKIASLRLMSSLLQNNPKVQIYGYESGGIRSLLTLLTLEKEDNVQYYAIAALSSLLRRFPLAQNKFISEGGIFTLTKILDKQNIKLNVKIFTLMSDLIREHQLVISENDRKDTLEQYEQIKMEEKLFEYSWCDYLGNLFNNGVLSGTYSNDYMEKILNSMNIFMQSCIKTYDVKGLENLSKKYSEMALVDIDKDADSSQSSYYFELKELCDTILQKMQIKVKTEL